MCKTHGIVMLALAAVIVAGCGKSESNQQTSNSPPSNAAWPVASAGAAGDRAKLDGPAAAVYDFLEAVRTGNDETAGRLLSTAAREKTASLNRSVTPPASDTAQFNVGKVDYLDGDRAAVACTWTDLDEQRQPTTDAAVWVLRRESEGWRVAGVQAQIFPGEPPVQLNFEDPEDLLRKKQWVREEMRRRMEQEPLQAKDQGNQEKQIVR